MLVCPSVSALAQRRGSGFRVHLTLDSLIPNTVLIGFRHISLSLTLIALAQKLLWANKLDMVENKNTNWKTLSKYSGHSQSWLNDPQTDRTDSLTPQKLPRFSYAKTFTESFHGFFSPERPLVRPARTFTLSHLITSLWSIFSSFTKIEDNCKTNEKNKKILGAGQMSLRRSWAIPLQCFDLGRTKTWSWIHLGDRCPLFAKPFSISWGLCDPLEKINQLSCRDLHVPHNITVLQNRNQSRRSPIQQSGLWNLEIHWGFCAQSGKRHASWLEPHVHWRISFHMVMPCIFSQIITNHNQNLMC